MTQKLDPILIDVPMPIITPRLILSPPQTGDGKASYDAKQDSWSELQQWMLWTKEENTEKDSEAFAREQHAKFLKREEIMVFAFDRERPNHIIAASGLHNFNWETRIFEIGYWVRTPEAGKGYATEITNALLRYAFNALSAHKVTINHAEGNISSQRVIEKLGFEKEGTARQEEQLPNGDMVDLHTYARFDADNLPNIEVSWGINP